MFKNLYFNQIAYSNPFKIQGASNVFTKRSSEEGGRRSKLSYNTAHLFCERLFTFILGASP